MTVWRNKICEANITTDAVARLTGCPPRGIAQFVRDHAGLFATDGEAGAAARAPAALVGY